MMLVAGKMLLVGALVFVMLAHLSVVVDGDDNLQQITPVSTFPAKITCNVRTPVNLSALSVTTLAIPTTCEGNYCYTLISKEKKSHLTYFEAGCVKDTIKGLELKCISAEEPKEGEDDIKDEAKELAEKAGILPKDFEVKEVCISDKNDINVSIDTTKTCHSYGDIPYSLSESAINSLIENGDKCITDYSEKKGEAKNTCYYSASGTDINSYKLFGGCVNKDEHCKKIKGGCTTDDEIINDFFGSVSIKGEKSGIKKLCCCEGADCNTNRIELKTTCPKYDNVNIFDESAVNQANHETNTCPGEFCFQVVIEKNNIHYATAGCLDKKTFIEKKLSETTPCKENNEINQADKDAAAMVIPLTGKVEFKKVCLSKQPTDKLDFPYKKTCFKYNVDGSDEIIKDGHRCKSNNVDKDDDNKLATCFSAAYTKQGSISKRIGGCVEKLEHCNIDECLHGENILEKYSAQKLKEDLGLTEIPHTLCCCKGTGCNGNITTMGAATSTISLALLVVAVVVGLHSRFTSAI